jgi:hypothetical protein
MEIANHGQAENLLREHGTLHESCLPLNLQAPGSPAGTAK